MNLLIAFTICIVVIFITFYLINKNILIDKTDHTKVYQDAEFDDFINCLKKQTSKETIDDDDLPIKE